MKAFLTKFVRTEAFRLLLLAAVSFAAMSPVLLKGIPFGYDLPHHYQCAFTFAESIEAGDFYPAWSSNRNFGFGGMETRLYPPVSHYSLALSHLLLGDWHAASWLVFFFYTLLGALGAYLWAREYMPPAQAVAAGCIYALLPYHLNQIYNTFFFAEFVGSSVLPFAFVFVSRVCRRGKWSDVVGLAIAFAALVLTHLPLTVIGSICFAIYALARLERERFVRQISMLAAGAFGGLAASAFFWIKVVEERDLMAKTLVYADPWLDYRFHFLLTPIQTFTDELQTRIFENSTFFYDLMFLCPVLLAAAFAAPPIAEKRSRLRRMKGVWLVFGLSVFLAVPFSRFVWDAAPLLQEVQFPWRWLAIVSLAASVLASGGFGVVAGWFRTKRRPFALIVSGVLLGVVTFSISQIVRPAPFIERAEVEQRMKEYRDREGFTFWWTIWTRREAFENKEKISAAGRAVTIRKWEPAARDFEIGAGDPSSARVAVFYHPNWKASVNGAAAETAPDENGALLIPVSAARSTISLNFVESLAVSIGQWISAAAWLCFAIFGLLASRKRFAAAKKPTDGQANKQTFWQILERVYRLSSGRYAVLLPLGASFLAILPMILFGVHQGGDLQPHVQFASTFRDAILAGDFYPSWGGDENSGYGSVGLRVYPPLTAFLFAVFKILLGDWHTASWTVFLLFSALGSFGAYLWAKEFVARPNAVWAGVLFALTPYHLFEIYNASMYAEFAGFSIAPFCFLFVTRICRHGKLSDVLGLAVSFACLILTHLPLILIGSLGLLVYSLSMLRRERFWTSLFGLGAGALLGLAASSVYWLRMLSEKDWMRNAKFWHDRHFEYDANFLFNSLEIDARQIWFFNLMLFALIVLVGGTVAAAFLKAANSEKKRLRPLLALFCGSVLMTTVLSLPLWATLPYLHEVQFPWRWLTIAGASGCVLASAGGEALQKLARSSDFWRKTVQAYALATLFLFGGLYGLLWVGFQINVIPASRYDAWVSEKSRLLSFEWFWTVETAPEAFSISEKIIAGGRNSQIDVWDPEERVFTVEAGAPARARIATLYYPHWRATVNDQPAETGIAEDGALTVALPAENATVKIRFEEPPLIRFAEFLSLAAWIVIGAAGSFVWFRAARFKAFADRRAETAFSK